MCFDPFIWNPRAGKTNPWWQKSESEKETVFIVIRNEQKGMETLGARYMGVYNCKTYYWTEP